MITYEYSAMMCKQTLHFFSHLLNNYILLVLGGEVIIHLFCLDECFVVVVIIKKNDEEYRKSRSKE